MNKSLAVFFILIVFQYIQLIYSREVHFWKLDGEECFDICDKRGKPYYWCNTVESGLRNCSKQDGYDLFNRKCINGCDSTKRKGCEVEIINSSKKKTIEKQECSEVRDIPKTYTNSSEVCKNTCSFYKKNYSWCYTNKGWGYCDEITFITFKKN